MNSTTVGAPYFVLLYFDRAPLILCTFILMGLPLFCTIFCFWNYKIRGPTVTLEKYLINIWSSFERRWESVEKHNDGLRLESIKFQPSLLLYEVNWIKYRNDKNLKYPIFSKSVFQIIQCSLAFNLIIFERLLRFGRVKINLLFTKVWSISFIFSPNLFT